jgi:hypothetical protein
VLVNDLKAILDQIVLPTIQAGKMSMVSTAGDQPPFGRPALPGE